MKGIRLDNRERLDKYVDIITKSLNELPDEIILEDECYNRLTGFDATDINLVIVPVYKHKLKRFKILSSFQYMARRVKDVQGNKPKV